MSLGAIYVLPKPVSAVCVLTAHHVELLPFVRAQEWWGAQTFLFAAICLLEGWAAHADELWQPDRLREEQTGNHGRSSRANAQKSARDDLARLRGRSANSLHLMARLMADPDSKCKARVIAYVLGAESRAASRMFRELRSSEMTREIYSGWSHWSWLTVAVDMLSLLENLDQLHRIGFSCSGIADTCPAAVASENVLAGWLFDLMRAVLKHRAGSALWYTCGAGSAAGLLHKDPAKAAASLKFFQSAHSVLVPQPSATIYAFTCMG